MNRRLVFALWAMASIMVLIQGFSGVAHADPKLERLLKTEAPIQWKEHQRLALRSTGTVDAIQHLTIRSNESDQVVDETEKHFFGSFASQGGLIKAVYRSQAGSTEYVCSRARDYGFYLYRDGQQNKYVISNVEITGVQNSNFLKHCTSVLMSATGLESLQLPMMVADPTFRLLAIDEVDGDETQVRLRCDYAPEGIPARRDLQIVLDRSNGWAVLTWEEIDGNLITSAVTTYESELRGANKLRLPNKQTLTVRNRDEKENSVLVCTRTLNDAEFDIDMPDAEFGLSHFGLPEPNRAGPSSRWRGWLLPVVAIQVGLLLILAVRYRNRKTAVGK